MLLKKLKSFISLKLEIQAKICKKQILFRLDFYC